MKEAILRFRVALLMQPDFPEAHLNLALALRDSGKIDDALFHARRGASLRPRDAKAARLVQELERRLLKAPR